MINVKSRKLYSVSGYLELMTGKTYKPGADIDDDVKFIHDILEKGYGYDPGAIWDFSLDEIAHIVENDCSVVLVDCMVWNEQTEEFEHELRWFEVDMCEEDETLED